jgi:hypothetical protein
VTSASQAQDDCPAPGAEDRCSNRGRATNNSRSAVTHGDECIAGVGLPSPGTEDRCSNRGRATPAKQH